MSTGKRLLPVQTLFKNLAVSGTNVYESKPVNIQNFDTIPFELVWTGTMSGQFVILASVTGINYFPLPGFTVNSPIGSTGGDLVDIWGTSFNWLILQYINASGSGEITASTSGKAF